MLKVKDRTFRIFIILLPLVLMMYINGMLARASEENIIRTVISFFAIVLVCEGGRFLIYNSHRWFSRRFRVLLVFATGIGYTTLIMALSTITKAYFNTGNLDFSKMMDSNIVINGDNVNIGLFGYSMINAVVNFSVVFLGYEIVYRQAMYRYANDEKERLEKEKLRAELQQLKGIVNPHFLFNNLNSLSSLISESPERAQDFLDELTKVFRYLLHNNQTELTTLAQEADFIQNYYQLLQTRYGRAIQMEMKIDEADRQLMLPPLTLQLLVENAVKHNRLQKEDPLLIEIFSAGNNKLVVRNSILRKEGRVESTGIGLQTINARYRMLNQQGVTIEKNEQQFTVIITLL